MNEASAPALRTGQYLHFSSLSVLLLVLALVWLDLGKPVPLLFWSAVAFPVLHQVYVWICWRAELVSGVISGTIGFLGYLIVFFALFAGRFVALVLLASADQDSLHLPDEIAVLAAIAFALPGIYTIYSVHRYFGVIRAAGADHFDEKYRKMPLVKDGIFRFTSNAMYLYAFSWFWAIAIAFNSLSAVVVAAFSHIYIWVHYYATEKPDMDYLYAKPPTQS